MGYICGHDGTGDFAGALMWGSNARQTSGWGGTSNWKYIANEQSAMYQTGDGKHRFFVAGAGSADATITWNEAVNIDNSGNLLVNRTSSTSSTVGCELDAIGRAMFTRASGVSLLLNITTDDGDIAEFRKDNVPVGSIGVSSSDNLYIAGSVASHAGLNFGTNQIIPLSSGGSGDNTVDLGNNGNYFKDVLVKGGIRFGTNTSANYLDDYEEGSYTVGIFDAGSGGNQSPTTTTGYYTKIGDMVFFSFNITGIDITGLTSGNNASFSLPFTSSSTQNKNFCALVHVLASDVNWAGSQTQLSSFVGTSTSRFQFWVSGDNIAVATVKVSEISSADFYVSGQFRV
jgi:hypothetical protein